MSLFTEKAKEYAFYRSSLLTQIIHSIAVTLIFFSVMILLGFIQISISNTVLSTNLAWIATLLLLVRYFRLNMRLTAILVPIFILLNFLADLISSNGPTTGTLEVWVALVITASFLLLFVYFYEKNYSSLKQFFSLLIFSPLFLVAEAVFCFGFFNGLKKAIHGMEASVAENKIKKDTKVDSGAHQ